MKRFLTVLSLLVLSACAAPVTDGSRPMPGRQTPSGSSGDRVSPDTAAANFVAVARRMEPLIERECRVRDPGFNCNFMIVVDSRPGEPPNAFQTIDRSGRPVIAFTVALIAEARNRDELAFVLGHEAAHHIDGHLPRAAQNAQVGALVLGTLIAAGGGDTAAIDAAQNIGGALGARRYAKDYELEADELGTELAWRAGYNPARGAAFFTRIPDPGNQFLGSHPPNAERIRVVDATLARLTGG